MTDWVLAVDIGGTKLAAARIFRDGGVTGRQERRTPTLPDPHAVWAELQRLLQDVVGDDRPAGVGVGCGGPMDRAVGVVAPINISGWRDGFPLRDRIAQWAGAEVALHNDAIAMALGEQRYGAGRASSALLGVVVSTGVGGGIVLQGRAVDGRTGNAGHVGHVVVEPGGPQCGCGGHGCLEAVARGPALVAWAQRQGWRPDDLAADGRALLAAARAGDQVAIDAFARGGAALGLAFASVAAVLDLDTIVVGGGISNAGDLLLEPARRTFTAHARLEFLTGTRIVPSELGADAGLVGAGILAWELVDGGAH